MNTRLRFKKNNAGQYIAGPFQANTKTTTVLIHNDGLSFQLIVDGLSYHYQTDNMQEAKKLSKQLLLDAGVVFKSEIRHKKLPDIVLSYK